MHCINHKTVGKNKQLSRDNGEITVSVSVENLLHGVEPPGEQTSAQTFYHLQLAC